jgi:alpha-D-xyloside xylohydrolase
VKQGMYEHLEAPEDTINVHVRHGSIIPMQEFAMTTATTRKTPFSLLIVFSPVFDVAAFCTIPYSIACQGIYMEYATGQIFLDDDAQLRMEGTLIKLEATRKDGHYVLKSLVTEGSYAAKLSWVLLHNLIVSK